MVESLPSAGGSGGGGKDNNGNGRGNDNTGNRNNRSGGSANNGKVNNASRLVLTPRSESLRNVMNNFYSGRRLSREREELVVPLSGIIKVVRRASPPRVNVKRCLFGASDPNERRAWIVRQLRRIKVAKEREYNFDFDNFCPKDNVLSNRYTWERVVVPEEPVSRELTGAAAEARRNGNQEVDSSPEDSGPEEVNGNNGDIKRKRQAKVTEFMVKTKKVSNDQPGKQGEQAKEGHAAVITATTMTTI